MQIFSSSGKTYTASPKYFEKHKGENMCCMSNSFLDSEHETAEATIWADPPKRHTLKDEVFGKQRKETTSISCWAVLIPEHAKAREPFRHILKISIAFRRSRKTFVFSVFVLNSEGRREHLSISSPLLESTHSRARALFEIFQKQQEHMRFLLGRFEQQTRPGNICPAWSQLWNSKHARAMDSFRQGSRVVRPSRRRRKTSTRSSTILNNRESQKTHFWTPNIP
jgi:hypothetical protein